MTVPKPVVFLDIDGVLCTIRACVATGDKGGLKYLDPIAVKCFERILESVNAQYVVSSSWRIIHPDIPAILKCVGLHGEPFYPDDWKLGTKKYKDSREFYYTPRHEKQFRGHEVDMWLDRYGKRPYIILDDESDFTDYQKKHHLIKTDEMNGILFEHMEEAIDNLKKQVENWKNDS